MKDMLKRKRIMEKSMKLGHCICDPRKPCPCDLFKEKNVCECAGERMPVPVGEVRLTQYVRNPGCASKIPKKDLDEVLAGLPEIGDDRVVVGRTAGDDAGVIMLSKDTATILTVDVFSPSVDDPYTFGQIAAANSVSDIYAMGSTPQCALSIIGFPIHMLPAEIMRQILQGGIDKMKEAGISVIGGHSINEEEIQCGFALLGTSFEGKFITNSGAKVGDAIVLTKPLGVGIVVFANQIGRASEGAMDEVTTSMSSLNKFAGRLIQKYGVNAATDVTGFGLLGHMAEVVKNSAIEVELDFDRIPLFESVMDLARQGVLPGAVERNREAIDEAMLGLSELASSQQSILFCPETSGGLLVFLPEDKTEAFVKELVMGGATAASVIGKVVAEREGGKIRMITSRAQEFAPLPLTPFSKAAPVAAEPVSLEVSCCCPDGAEADSKDKGTAAGTPVAAAAKASEAFKAYMAAVNAPGALGVKEKKLISLALSVLSKCEPCVNINTKAARDGGATEDEVAEAVALGIAFGGAPVAMFYNRLKE